jgi:hypothetical protein
MADKISIEEAKRRRREREMLLPITGGKEPPQHVNGRVREIAVAGWHELGETERQDNMIGGMLGSEQFAMVYGESGSGKSFFAFDMAAHYALTREWMGRRVKGGGVLYIAAEGRSSWANRVEAFCRHHGIDEEGRALVSFGFVLEPINLGRTGNGDVAAVIRASERLGEKLRTAVDLIIVDTMARATPGANENDAGDMSAFVSNMDAIRKATKASQLIVHHSGKNASLGARGHSSLRAAVDLELEVERLDGGGRILRIRKSRDGNDGDEQGFDLNVVELGRDEDGEPITSCVVVPSVVQETTKRRRNKDRQKWEQALPIFDNTLLDYPENGPRNSKLPSNVTMTKLDRFHEALQRASIIDSDVPSTRRKQWQRIKEKLQAKDILKIDGDLCWRGDV